MNITRVRAVAGKECREILRDLDPLLAHSDIRFAIIVPPKFQENLLAGRSVGVQSIIDGTFPFRTSTSKGYVIAINTEFNGELLAGYISRPYVSG